MSSPIPILSIDWQALVQVIGFIATIIAIVTATYKIIKKLTSIEKDVDYLKSTVEKNEKN